MAAPVRHRQTKGAATDRVDLQPPRHTPTLPPSLKGGFRSFTNTGVDGWVAPIGSRGEIPTGSDTPITGTSAILEARGAPPVSGSTSLLTRGLGASHWDAPQDPNRRGQLIKAWQAGLAPRRCRAKQTCREI